MSALKNTVAQKPVYSILVAISAAHLLNDLLQAVIPAIYPRLEQKYGLSLAQIGMITLCYQLAASIFQPVVGAYTDKKPKPYSQIAGMFFTMARSEEHTSELQSRPHLVCRLLLEKKKKKTRCL